jgi:hypothetical protein
MCEVDGERVCAEGLRSLSSARILCTLFYYQVHDVLLSIQSLVVLNTSHPLYPHTYPDTPLCMVSGIPTGVCKELGSGTYSRSFTKGTATLDCNTWTATLDFK